MVSRQLTIGIAVGITVAFLVTTMRQLHMQTPRRTVDLQRDALMHEKIDTVVMNITLHKQIRELEEKLREEMEKHSEDLKKSEELIQKQEELEKEKASLLEEQERLLKKQAEKGEIFGEDIFKKIKNNEGDSLEDKKPTGNLICFSFSLIYYNIITCNKDLTVNWSSLCDFSDRGALFNVYNLLVIHLMT